MLATICQAQTPFTFTPIDTSTPTTNTVSSSGTISVTYSNVYVAAIAIQTNGSGVVTNLAVTLGTNVITTQPYFSYRTGVILYGDPPITEANKINLALSNAAAAFAGLQGGVTTNYQFLTGNILSPTTNSLNFTNGVAR